MGFIIVECFYVFSTSAHISQGERTIFVMRGQAEGLFTKMIRKHYIIEAIGLKSKMRMEQEKEGFSDCNRVCVLCLTHQFLPLVLLSWWLLIITQLWLFKMAHQHAAANTIIFNSILITTHKPAS